MIEVRKCNNDDIKFVAKIYDKIHDLEENGNYEIKVYLEEIVDAE